MKKLSHIVAAVALLFTAAVSAKADDMEGLELKSLWKQYESYTKEDKPKKAAEVLTQIKKKAREDRLAYDFYKAGQDYINVRRSINWKESQGLYDDFAKEVRRSYRHLLVDEKLWRQELGREVRVCQKECFQARESPQCRFLFDLTLVHGRSDEKLRP